MFDGFRIGRVFGIPVSVNWTLLIIGALFAWSLASGFLPTVAPGWGGASYLVSGALVAVVFFASVLAHELAHAVVARRNGVEVEGITLWLLGGVAKLRGRIPDAGAEFRIAAAGPASSLLIGAGFAGLAYLADGLGLAALGIAGLSWLAFVNVVLAVFNSIPAAPLDGGRVLAAGLWRLWHDRSRAEIVATKVGTGFGVVLVGFGVWQFAIGGIGLWTILLGWFVLNAAATERRHARLEHALGDRRVVDVMTPDPDTVAGWRTVGDLRRDPPGSRHSTLVVLGWDGSVRGVVRPEWVRRVPAEQADAVRVEALARPAPTVGGEDSLADVLSAGAAPPFVVVSELGALRGIVTEADLHRPGSRHSSTV